MEERGEKNPSHCFLRKRSDESDEPLKLQVVCSRAPANFALRSYRHPRRPHSSPCSDSPASLALRPPAAAVSPWSPRSASPAEHSNLALPPSSPRPLRQTAGCRPGPCVLHGSPLCDFPLIFRRSGRNQRAGPRTTEPRGARSSWSSSLTGCLSLLLRPEPLQPSHDALLFEDHARSPDDLDAVVLPVGPEHVVGWWHQVDGVRGHWLVVVPVASHLPRGSGPCCNARRVRPGLCIGVDHAADQHVLSVREAS